MNTRMEKQGNEGKIERIYVRKKERKKILLREVCVCVCGLWNERE